jgi:hypothetical protein
LLTTKPGSGRYELGSNPQRGPSDLNLRLATAVVSDAIGHLEDNDSRE